MQLTTTEIQMASIWIYDQHDHKGGTKTEEDLCTPEDAKTGVPRPQHAARLLQRLQ